MSEDSIRLPPSIERSIMATSSRRPGCCSMVPSSSQTTTYRHRAKRRRPSTSSSNPIFIFFTTHHLLVIILLQLLSITVINAMIYLEEPAQALIYDSLPDPPDRHVISQVFLSNLTEGGLDNVRFRVGTPLHYLRAYSSSDSNEDEELAVVTPVLSDEVLNGGNSTSYANATTSAVDDINTTTITSNNETVNIINDTSTNNNNANETISSSTNNTANSTVFERRTISSQRGFVPTYEKPSSQSLSPPSDEEPTIEISGEYTDIIHHNPQSNNNNNGGDIIIKDNHGNSLTITELLGFFNDSKLVFEEVKEEEQQYVLYDSRQARFGTDLGPKGNAAFVNIMLPPRWGEDLDNMDVVDDGMGDVGEQQDGGISESNSEIADTNATTADVDSVVLNDQPIRGLQDIDELLGLVDDESFDNNSTGVEGESGEGTSNETEIVITETNYTEENTLFDDEIATIDVVNTSASLNDATATDQVEEFNGEFDTHISSYFCLDDFINWRSKRSSSINNDTAIPASSSSTILSIDNLNAVNSTRGIALMVQRGRCSFQNKAELAMVFNDLLASAGKSNRIDNIIVYNNGTIDKTNNGTNGDEKLVEMLLVPKRNDTLFESIKPINVGMVYITTGSGRDLMHRMIEQQNKLGISPHMDMSSILPARDTTSSGWSRSLLINESTQNDGQHDGSVVQEDAPIHDETIANGWYFPATLSRFCLSCGEQTDYGFYPFLVGDSQYRPGQNPRPTWPPNFSDDYYTPRRWVEMIRRLMIAILVLLLVGPVVLATHRWHHVGGTIRWQTDENGRRRLRIISPNLELFVNGVHDAVETNGTKLDRAQVFALPEIVYNPSSSDSGRDVSENVCESPLMVNESGVSSGSFRENGDRCIDSEPTTAGTIENDAPSQPAPISPSGRASEMYESSTCCPICIEEFEAGEMLRVLPRCKHLFHTECILPWLTKRQGCCPQCRTPVLPDEFQQRSRSSRSSPLRRSSGLSASRRERDGQQTEEESDTSLSGTRLFSGTEELPQQNQGSISVPHAAEVNESHPSHTENVNESSHELMEQGIASNEVPPDDTSEAANGNTEPIGQELASSEVPISDNDVSAHVGIAAVVSSDDIESNNSALAPIEDEENTQNNIPDPPQMSSVGGNGFNPFLTFLNTPNNRDVDQRGAKDKEN